MTIDLRDQARNRALPLKCATVYSGSMLALDLIGVPSERGGVAVEGVTVEVVNPAGMPVSAECFVRRGIHRCRFSASNFEVYGFVAKGLRVKARYEDGETETLGIGDFEVLASSGDAVKGEVTGVYMTKGSDVYLKSEIVDGVQHYVKQRMVNDPEIGWGAIWEGSFVLSAEGEFVEVKE